MPTRFESGETMTFSDKPDIIAEGNFIQFVRRGTWEYVTRRGISGIVALVAVTMDRKLVLVEQYRPALRARVIELPAGIAGDGVHKGESLEAAARRELLEETGYSPSELKLVATGAASAGITDELISLFVARGLRKVGLGEGDGTEELVLHEVPLDEVGGWLQKKCQAGFLVDLKVFSGIYFAGLEEKKPSPPGV
jgi:ADP-ribose pyrophosphatase